MSYNTLAYQLAFTPTLKTREMIRATVDFRVDVLGAGFALVFFTPFRSFEHYREAVRVELSAKAESATNQWAFQFASADAALDRSAYDSLRKDLGGLSGSFRVRSVVVRSIVPVTDRVPEPPPAPAPPPPQPTHRERAINDFKDKVEGLGDFIAYTEESKTRHSVVWGDPDAGQLLKDELWRAKRDLFLKRGR